MTSITCKCGEIELSIEQNIRGTRVQCYCESCRGFVKTMGAPDHLLNHEQGIECFHTTPNDIKINKGAELLAAKSISQKGAMRWHCDKCQTPLADTRRNSSIPFIAVLLPRESHLPNAPEFGTKIKVIHQYHARPNATNQGRNNQGLHNMIWGVLSRWAIKLITGKVRKSDWHNGKDWRVAATVMTKSERDKLYKRAKTL